MFEGRAAAQEPEDAYRFLKQVSREVNAGYVAAVREYAPRLTDELRLELMKTLASVSTVVGPYIEKVVKKRDGWAGESGGRTVPRTKAPTKAEAVKKVAAAAKRDPQPVSVRIHKTDGKIQEERTYPRSADPRRSKG